MDDKIYDELYRRLLTRGSNVRHRVPFPAEFTSSEKRRVQNCIQRSTFYIARVPDPLTGVLENRLIRRSDDRIELKRSEADRSTKYLFRNRKGECADKIFKALQWHGYTVRRQEVRQVRKDLPDVTAVAPSFRNKAPLTPIRAENILQRRQIDLTDLSSYQMMENNRLFKYALTSVDVFSRYETIHPLETKSALGVATQMFRMSTGFGGHLGTCTIVQSDNGTEFKDKVEELLKLQNTELIHSSPYHPESQGKVERQQKTWKKRLLYDVRKGQTNWVTQLSGYANLHNSSPHSTFKNQYTPHEVMFGRKNILASKPNADGKHLASEVRVVYDRCEERRTAWLGDITSMRNRARKLSREVDDIMVKKNLARHPPSLYNPGEEVLAKVPVKMSKKSVTCVVKAKIVKRYITRQRYKIEYTAQTRSGLTKQMTVSVNSITSTTESEEIRRQEHAKELAARGFFKEWIVPRKRSRNHAPRSNICKTGQVCVNRLCRRRVLVKCDFNKCMHCCKNTPRRCSIKTHNRPYFR
ncbi:uncharacterized protein LOC144923020 [Branchiostoma floridae x Branchiostoma belcheri]